MYQEEKQSYLTEQFSAFSAFLTNPQYQYEQQSFGNKLKQFFTLYGFNLIAVFFVMLLIALTEVILPEGFMDENKVSEFIDTMPVWVVFLMAAIAAPVWEELVFRFPLKYREVTINIFVGLLLVIALGAAVYNTTLIGKIIFISIIVALAILYSVFSKRILRFLQDIWQNKFPVVFYCFTLAFALIHLRNYPSGWTTVLLFPILVLPQFVIGLFMGYVRIKLGIGWSIAFHALHNAIFVGVALFGLGNQFEPLHVEKAEYTLTINKSESGKYDEITYIVDREKIEFKNHNFKFVVAELIDKDSKYVEFDNTLFAKTRLNIVFKPAVSYKNEKEARETVLKEMKKAYGFSLKNHIESVVEYKLFVKDEGKLSRYKDRSINEVFSFDNDSVSFKGATIQAIARQLNSLNDARFITTNKGTEKYSISYPRNLNTEEIEAYFAEHFGIVFKKGNSDVEFTTVVFESNQ